MQAKEKQNADLKEYLAKLLFEGISCETVEEFEKNVAEIIKSWITSLKEYGYINYSEIRKIIMIDDAENIVKILK